MFDVVVYLFLFILLVSHVAEVYLARRTLQWMTRLELSHKARGRALKARVLARWPSRRAKQKAVQP